MSEDLMGKYFKQFTSTASNSKTVWLLTDGLTVDVLADVFPLNIAVFVIPLSQAISYHLATVLSRLITPVVRLALHPGPETEITNSQVYNYSTFFKYSFN